MGQEGLAVELAGVGAGLPAEDFLGEGTIEGGGHGKAREIAEGREGDISAANDVFDGVEEVRGPGSARQGGG